MTVIRPNSISGVSSITGSGGDISIFRADGTAADVTVNNITSGVVTATTGTFTGNLGVGGVLTYEDVTNIDSVGVITARSGLNVSGGTATFAGNINANGRLNVDGHTDLDNVNIVGVVTVITSTAPTLNNNTHAGEALFLRSGGSDGDGNVQSVIAFGKADSSSLRSGSAIASVQTDSDADKIGIGFYTSPSSTSSQTLSQKLLIKHDGNITANSGNIIIGTAGKGIDFSAQTPTSISGTTTTAEILDHYEEGTFTAFLANVSAPTYEAQGGRFTRIGRMVFCDCTIGVASGLDTSDGSAFQIQGLPFTGSAGGGDTSLFSLGRYTNLLGGKQNSVRNVRYTGGGVILQEGSNSDIAYNEVSSSGYLQISFAYMIA